MSWLLWQNVMVAMTECHGCYGRMLWLLLVAMTECYTYKVRAVWDTNLCGKYHNNLNVSAMESHEVIFPDLPLPSPSVVPYYDEKLEAGLRLQVAWV